MSDYHIDTNSNTWLGILIWDAAQTRVPAITGGSQNSPHEWKLRQSYADYATMQLNRAVAGKPLAKQPTETQMRKGLTPELADDALDAVAEALRDYMKGHLIEGLKAADAFGISNDVLGDLQEVIG